MTHPSVRFGYYNVIASEERSDEKDKLVKGFKGTLVFDSHFYDHDETSKMYPIAENSEYDFNLRSTDFGIVKSFI